MKKYKYTNAEQTSVNLIEDGVTKVFGIHPGVYLWEDVQKYLDDGGIIEEFQTATEKKEKDTNDAEAKLKTKKKELREEGITVNGILFDTDLEARIAYLELMIKFMMDPSYVVQDWKASDGVWVQMDKTTFDSLVAAWEVKLGNIFTFVKTKESEISESSDPSTIIFDF